MNISLLRKRSLEAGVAVPAIALMSVAFAAPAFAQDNSAPATAQSNQQTVDTTAGNPPAADANDRIIVVTGTLTRNPAAATASPVVSLSSDDLTKRGLSNVADAVQSLTANNQGTAPPSWSSVGFATGASAPSLRGLNDAYTLTLFDGLRTAPYPLPDDGYRNFVDINTIPGSVVQQIDVLQDGASATYGSDAIAGVINVIVKPQIQGFHFDASAALSQRQDYGDRKFSGTYGYGDLQSQGFNVFVNGEYEYTDGLRLASGRRTAEGYPIGTGDLSMICGTTAQGCLTNGVRNGIQADGTFNGFQSTQVPFVRPYSINPATGGVGSSRGGYQFADPAAGCLGLPSVTLTAAQRNGVITPATVCQEDRINEYLQYDSPTERIGGTIRGTFKIGENAEAYAMFNYYDTKTHGTYTNLSYTSGTTPSGTANNITTVAPVSVFLPQYVCSAGVGAIDAAGRIYATGCNAGNGTLNPSNPFAAAGQMARLVAAFPYARESRTDAKTYRFATGIHGSFSDGFNYDLRGTYSQANLDLTYNGYPRLQGILDAVAKGTYNFDNPYNNSAAATQALFPTVYNNAVSKLSQIILTLDKDVIALPGGEMNVAVSGSYRYEAIHDPSANPDNPAAPNSRFYGINAVGVDGSRHVWSAAYEISAPILSILKVKAEGSYDHYSNGFSHFSPKFEAEFKPIEQIKLRGTYSKGFHAPSFSELYATPTTGYTVLQINCSNATYAAFCAQHDPAYYAGGYQVGLTSYGNLALKPERSTGLTAGVVFQPTRRIALTADFWSVKLQDVIVPSSLTNTIARQYYANNGVVTVPGVSIVPATADPNGNAGALPLIGYVVAPYVNASSYLAKGLDFSANGSVPIGPSMTWRTNASASYLIRLQQVNANGDVQRYDGTLGACNITSCSGAPKWRAVWQNTLDFNGKASLTLTANYTSGFTEVATDSGGTYGDCKQSAADGQVFTYNNGDPVQCKEKSTFYLDGHGEVYVTSQAKVYFDVKNIMDRKANFTPNAAYGLYDFNPAWQDSLFIGRYFRIGAKVDF